MKSEVVHDTLEKIGKSSENYSKIKKAITERNEQHVDNINAKYYSNKVAYNKIFKFISSLKDFYIVMNNTFPGLSF